MVRGKSPRYSYHLSLGKNYSPYFSQLSQLSHNALTSGEKGEYRDYYIESSKYKRQRQVKLGSTITGSNEQRLLAVFPSGSFNKENAAQALGMSASGAYKLLQRMKEQGMFSAIKSGKQWMYSIIRRGTSPDHSRVVGLGGRFRK